MWSTIKDDEELAYYKRQLKQSQDILKKQAESHGQEKISAVFIDKVTKLIKFLNKNIEAYEILRNE